MRDDFCYCEIFVVVTEISVWGCDTLYSGRGVLMSQRNLLPLLSFTVMEATGSSDDMLVYIYCVVLCRIPGYSHQVCCLIYKSFLLLF